MTLERVIAAGERTACRMGIHLRLPKARRVHLIGKPKKSTVIPHIASRQHASKTPITDAMIELVNRRVPNDPRGRVFADLLAEAIFRQALKGDIKAIKEIADRIEGRVGERVSANPQSAPDNVRVIWPTSVTNDRRMTLPDARVPEGFRSEAS